MFFCPRDAAALARVGILLAALKRADAAVCLALGVMTDEARDSDRETWNEGGDGYEAVTACASVMDAARAAIARAEGNEVAK
jgi:hypothetical protein